MKKLVFALTLCATSILTAQKTQKTEVLDSVMIATKINISRKNSGKVVTTITRAQLKNNQGQSVAQVLNQIAGFEMNGSRSNDGQNLGYFVRGGRNRQVLVVVDGVAVNDPSSIANDYDLRLIPAQTIERIEVLKGAASVLYGSGAATAVISITTLPASKDKIHASISSSIGTNRSAENSDGISVISRKCSTIIKGTEQ
jgi:vitamin B12 transporter